MSGITSQNPGFGGRQPYGMTAAQIIANPRAEHATWHFFQAMAWVDLAKSEGHSTALHYCALELRLGLERLLFDLLLLAAHGITEAGYKKCLGDVDEMRKQLSKPEIQYERRVEFTKVLAELDPQMPKLSYWNIADLYRSMGIASELLHFIGIDSRTHSDNAWFARNLNRIEGEALKYWSKSTETYGFGLAEPSTLEPEAYRAWEEFAAGTLTRGDLKIRLRIMQPILRARRDIGKL